MANWTAYDMGLRFSGKASGRTIMGLAQGESNPFVPALDKSYVFPVWGAEILNILSFEKRLYVFGPTGSGKTSAIKWIAGAFNIPVYEITGHSRLEFPELVGSYHLANQNMVWQDGPLTMAMRNGGIFLLNEQSLLDPATAAGLNTILDGSPLLIPETGECVKAHDAFVYIATDNTNGCGDTTGLYAGTLRQNQALMSRFPLVKADYLAPQIEAKILERACPTLPQDVREKMLQFVGEARLGNDPKSDNPLSMTISPRDYIRWGKLIVSFDALRGATSEPLPLYCMRRAFLYRASEADAMTLTALYQKIFV